MLNYSEIQEIKQRNENEEDEEQKENLHNFYADNQVQEIKVIFKPCLCVFGLSNL